MTCYYELLNVPSDATTQQIRDAYRRSIMTLHPDKSGSQLTRDAFDAVVAAYNVLVDSASRAQYDAKIMKLEAQMYNDVVDLSDMRTSPDSMVWEHDCRCGHTVLVTESDLDAGQSIFACEGCSAHLRVLYNVVEVTEQQQESSP